MKKITLDLPFYDMFNIACFELGRFFSDDSTPEECIAHWNNINVLRSEMDEHHLAEFVKIFKTFNDKKDLIKTKGVDIYNKFIEETKELYGF